MDDETAQDIRNQLHQTNALLQELVSAAGKILAALELLQKRE